MRHHLHSRLTLVLLASLFLADVFVFAVSLITLG